MTPGMHLVLSVVRDVVIFGIWVGVMVWLTRDKD